MIENLLIRLQALMVERTKRLKKLHHKGRDVCISFEYDGSGETWHFNYLPYIGNHIYCSNKNFNDLLKEVEPALRKQLAGELK